MFFGPAREPQVLALTFPWANTLLLVFIAAETVSGFLGLVSGSPDRAVFMQAHRVAGYGIVVLLVWKTANVVRSLRWHRATTPRAASLLLAVGLLATLALGFLWSYGGPFTFSMFSGVSWHIYVGAALLPLLVWHALYQTKGFPIAFWAERRSALRLGALSLAGLAFWQLGELGARALSLSGADRRFTGSYEVAIRAAGVFPVVSWLNDSPRPVDSEQWRLTIRGAIDREVQLAYDDMASDHTTSATIDCTGGWYSTQEWRGTPLASLLDLAGPSDRAASVTVRSVTGYYRRFSISEARSYLLATGVGGGDLSHGHGFPARLVAPGKRGFEWVKWVEAIDVNETPKWLQPPLPLH